MEVPVRLIQQGSLPKLKFTKQYTDCLEVSGYGLIQSGQVKKSLAPITKRKSYFPNLLPMWAPERQINEISTRTLKTSKYGRKWIGREYLLFLWKCCFQKQQGIKDTACRVGRVRDLEAPPIFQISKSECPFRSHDTKSLLKPTMLVMPPNPPWLSPYQSLPWSDPTQNFLHIGNPRTVSQIYWIKMAPDPTSDAMNVPNLSTCLIWDFFFLLLEPFFLWQVMM